MVIRWYLKQKIKGEHKMKKRYFLLRDEYSHWKTYLL